MFTVKKNQDSVIEKAVSVSRRPSQYAGWELGSSAKLIREADFNSRVALVWLKPYGEAMADPVLLEIYDALKESAAFLPERVFEPETDCQEALKNLNHGGGYFSLETKKGLEDFDFWIARGPLPELTMERLREQAQSQSKELFFLDESAALKKTVWEKFGLGGLKNQTLWPLVAYGAHEAKSLMSSSGGPAFPSVRLRFRVQMARWGWSRFVSHLEQIGLIKNALYASALPLSLGAGRKARHPRLSFGPAISVGWESSAEFFDVELNQPISASSLTARLKSFLPEGYEVLGAERVPGHFPSLEESVNWSEFEIEGPSALPWGALTDFAQQIREGQAQAKIVRKEKTPDKVELIDIRDVLAEAIVLNEGAARTTIKMSLRFGPKRNLKPERILEALMGLTNPLLAQEIKIKRVGLALEFQGGHLRRLCLK